MFKGKTRPFILSDPLNNLWPGICRDALAYEKTFENTMQGALKGIFRKARVDNYEFDYSPCLHIKTFRVAEVYGEKVMDFKKNLSQYIDSI